MLKFIQTIWRFWGLHGSFQKKRPYDILCFQFSLLVCRLHHTFLQKCLKPLEKYWRFNGVNIALFLDGGWLIDSDRDTCTTLAASIWSQWCPSQVCEWLGIIWNTINGTIALSERRENSIAIAIDRILSSDRSVSARVLASLLGGIISGGAVFGNISRLMTRYCSISVASAQNWDSKFYFDQYCIRELAYYFQKIFSICSWLQVFWFYCFRAWA